MHIADCYKILGISETQNLAIIRRSYLKLAKQWHPDINSTPEAKRKFQDLQTAYDTLKKAIETGTIQNTYNHQKVDPRTYAQERRRKIREEQNKIREQKIENLARKHAAEYVEILQSKKLHLFKLFFYCYVAIGLVLTFIVFYFTVMGFIQIGNGQFLYSILIIAMISLPLYYLFMFIKDFLFLVTKQKPTIKFQV